MYKPKPEHKFTFGLWTVGNPGRDPFGGPTRPKKSPVDLVYLLAEVGADDGSMAPFSGPFTAEKASALKAHKFNRQNLGARGYRYERLDQLTIKLLLGVR